MFEWFKKQPLEVVVKLQRPLMGDMTDILSYIVDEDDEQNSNPVLTPTSQEDMDIIFGEHKKVYWKGYYKKGKPVTLVEPCWEDRWV